MVEMNKKLWKKFNLENTILKVKILKILVTKLKN